MTRPSAVLALFFCAACYNGKVSLGTCNQDSECTAKVKGSTCDNHVCTYACPTICGVAEQCVNAQCIAIGPAITAVNAPTTWASPTQSITVTATADGTKTEGVASAALQIAGQADIPGTTTDTGLIKTFTFTVPGTVRTTPSEVPIDFKIIATSPTGKVTPPDAAGTGKLLFDGLGPKVNGVTITNGVPVGPAGQQINWFARTFPQNIDAVVSIQDGGSGVNFATLKLVLLSNGAQINTGGASCAPSTTGSDTKCHLSIPPATVPLPAGSTQGLVRFAVAGTDNVGNAVQGNTAAVGVDGKAPSITFNPVYPPAFKDCNAAVGDDGTIFCGHDGSHFYRAGDGKYNLSFTASDAASAPNDVGSGIDPASGTCTIVGSTSLCLVTFNPAGATFSFPAEFSTATFVSDATGAGTVQVNVNVKDLVGNTLTSAVQVPVNVTRLKWMRTMTGKVDTFKSSPVATSQPVPQVIFAGSERDLSGPIASFGSDGTVLWRAGRGDATTISNNVAYSSATHVLYVLGDNNAALFGYGVSATNSISKFNCPLTDSGTTANAVGSPVIVSAAPERALIGDAVGRLWSLAGTPGTGCATVGNTLTNNGGTWSGLGTPTFDGALVYLAHNATKLSTIAFNGAAFGAVTDAASFSQSILGSVAIATNLFFANQSVPGQVLSYTPAFGLRWSTATLLQDKLNAAPVVSSSYVFASPVGNDGQLHALSKVDGTEVWHWAAGTTKLGNISAPAFDARGVIYFSSDNPSQLVPLKLVATAPALADGWVEFKGSTTQKTTSGVDTTLDSLATAPVIDVVGTIFFGTAAGKVYALITDSGGPLVPVAGTTWPRVGYDNCNSSNTSFTCQ